MRILGIDYGKKRIGFAISDELGIMAHQLEVYTRKDLPDDIQHIKDIVTEKKVLLIVVGDPINMDGTAGPQSEAAHQFASSLQENLGMPVDTFDERLTTSQADSILDIGRIHPKKRKTLRDKIAAQFILQGYIDSLK